MTSEMLPGVSTREASYRRGHFGDMLMKTQALRRDAVWSRSEIVQRPGGESCSRHTSSIVETQVPYKMPRLVAKECV